VIDFPSIRAGIAAILGGIPEIKRVNPLEAPGENVNNLPCAYVHRGQIRRLPLTELGEAVAWEGLGQATTLVEWDIAVYSTLNGYASSQELDDLFAARLMAAFDAKAARQIDPNGPGVVDVSKLHQLEAFQQVEETPGLWVTQALLNTLITDQFV
jgi:hypothetical protein